MKFLYLLAATLSVAAALPLAPNAGKDDATYKLSRRFDFSRGGAEPAVDHGRGAYDTTGAPKPPPPPPKARPDIEDHDEQDASPGLSNVLGHNPPQV